jgi:hypothetical protein
MKPCKFYFRPRSRRRKTKVKEKKNDKHKNIHFVFLRMIEIPTIVFRKEGFTSVILICTLRNCFNYKRFFTWSSKLFELSHEKPSTIKKRYFTHGVILLIL